jgi:hypothetical protein
MLKLIVFCLNMLSVDVFLAPVADVNATFQQDVATIYTTAHGLPAEAATSLALTFEAPVVATKDGLARFNGHRWKTCKGPDFKTQHLCHHQGVLYAAGDGQMAILYQDRWEKVPLAVSDTITAMAPWEKGVAVAVGNTLIKVTDPGGNAETFVRELLSTEALQGPITAIVWSPIFADDAAQLPVPSAVQGFVGTDNGLYVICGSRVDDWQAVRVLPADARYSWAPRKVHALVGGPGWVWCGAENGAGQFADGSWTLYTGREGLPYNQFTCAAALGPGHVWFGTQWGALYHDETGWAYRAGRRWLASDHVQDVCVTPKGAAWIATDGGVVCIEKQPTTLAKKAAHYEALVDRYHRRAGLVVQWKLEEPGQLDTGRAKVGANDGGRTTRYGAAQAFRYAATGDPEAKERAKVIFKTLRHLVDVTGIPGFPARTIIKAKPGYDPNPPNQAARNRKRQQGNPWWKNIRQYHKSADGEWWWRCDTSSDEVVGHYFFLDTYYAYVAETPAEKAAVVELTRNMTDHLVRNNFCLIDYDGRPTRWGNWSPEFLSQFGAWPERGLYSLEMLTFLAVAEAITGDEKYAEAAETLRSEHNYHINARQGRVIFPPYHAAPHDINHALLCSYMLLRHTVDVDLRACYQSGLDRTWLWISDFNDPLFNVLYEGAKKPLNYPYYVDPNAYLNSQDRLQAAVQTLREMPLYLISWDMHNSHRLDVRRRHLPAGEEGFGWGHNGKALPVDERSQVFFDGSNLVLDGGDGGRSLRAGTWYLLSYYMGLYHGFWKD